MRTAYGHDIRSDPAAVRAALASAQAVPFWLDDPTRPQPRTPLSADAPVDLLVVGSGFCGLWTAIIAKERDPGRSVMLIEAGRIGWAASGRNGGFADASLTHGQDNGELHFADELPTLHRLATENFAGFAGTITRYGIDCEWEHTGSLTVATEQHQVEWLRRAADSPFDPGAIFLTGDALAAYGNSPLYRAGVFSTHGAGFVNPAKLAWGLAAVAEQLGVIIHENTQAVRLAASHAGAVEVSASSPGLDTLDRRAHIIRADRVALATNAFPALLPGLGMFTIPVYDYAITTQPLTDDQLALIGWTGRHGIADSSREFHYYRKTADNRILFGGYDAVYYRGGQVRPAHDHRPATWERLADHFFLTFPQLAGISFSHTWGGAIDMSTQLVAFHHLAKGGRVAYSAGYTGLGVVATRFGAATMLDLLAGYDTERTSLTMARRLPVPIPPEPIAYPLIQAIRRAVARSDRNAGKDGPLLKAAGLLGIGFDS